LAEAGYPGGRGFPTIDAYSSAGDNFAAAKYLHEWWHENLGVSIESKMISYDEYERLVHSDRPYLYHIGWVADYPDPDNFLCMALHQSEYTWHDDQYESLLETARRISDQSERLKLYQAADRLLINEAGIIPLLYDSFHLLIKPWVKRHPVSPLSCNYWKDVIIEPH
jgi:oligopeptide transport system substrate-binding protein